MMSRPLINLSGQELRSEYDKAVSTIDMVRLRSLAQELSHRRTPKARELLKEVEASLLRKVKGGLATEWFRILE
jgi:hypothetical protein